MIMPVIAALFWGKSNTVFSSATPAEPSVGLIGGCWGNGDVFTTILLVSPPALGSTYTGSSANCLHNQCPQCKPGITRCSSGEGGRWRRRMRGEDRGEWRVGVCDWPSCSDSTLHSLVLVTLPDPNYHKSAIIVANNGCSSWGLNAGVWKVLQGFKSIDHDTTVWENNKFTNDWIRSAKATTILRRQQLGKTVNTLDGEDLIATAGLSGGRGGCSWTETLAHQQPTSGPPPPPTTNARQVTPDPGKLTNFPNFVPSKPSCQNLSLNMQTKGDFSKRKGLNWQKQIMAMVAVKVSLVEEREEEGEMD